MQVTDTSPPAADGRAEARRSQIVLATIDLLATDGGRGVTFASIRQAAGLSSTRLISYHFASKDALLDSVVVATLAEAASIMRPAIDAENTIAGKLEAYIRSNLEFLKTRPNYARALIEALRSGSGSGRDAVAVSGTDDAVSLLAQLFAMGIASAEFREFDTVVMARSLRAAIDAIALVVVANTSLDLGHYADELVESFQRATRAESTR